MVFDKYKFPLPNNGERYDLSMEELVKLLDETYDKGFEDARNTFDPSRQSTITWASSEDVDDNTKWKEVWIK